MVLPCRGTQFILQKVGEGANPIISLHLFMSELRKICDAEYNIELEYTAPHTPQEGPAIRAKS